MCWDAASRVGYTLLCVAVAAVAVGAPVWLIGRAAGDRGALIGTWLFAVLLGLLYIIGTYTIVASDSGTWWGITVAVGALLGALVWRTYGRRGVSLVALGAIGAGTPAAVPLAVFVGLLAASGTCLD